MTQTVQSTWKENGGGVLLGVALFSMALASLLWYFKLLPEIDFTPVQPVGQNAPPPIQQPTNLIITIVSTGELQEKTVTGFVEVHNAFGDIGQIDDTINTHPFQLHNRGLTSVVVDDLSPGSYAPLIYIDLNGNGILDWSEKSRDPLRTATYPREYPQDKQLEKHSLRLEATSPTYLYIYF